MNAVTCKDCKFFEKDSLNPEAGLGYCRHPRLIPVYHKSHFANAPHYCQKREEMDVPELPA